MALSEGHRAHLSACARSLGARVCKRRQHPAHFFVLHADIQDPPRTRLHFSAGSDRSLIKDPPSHTAATLRSSNLPLTSLEPLTEARAERRRTGAHPITAYLQELERACAGSCWRLHRFKLLAARDRRMMLLPRAQAISAGYSNASSSHATRLGCCDDVSTFAGRRREPPDTCEAPQIFTGVSRQTPLLHWRCALQQDAGGIFRRSAFEVSKAGALCSAHFALRAGQSGPRWHRHEVAGEVNTAGGPTAA